MKILKVKIRLLAAWNNNRASGARQPVDISIKNKLNYRSARKLKHKYTHKKKIIKKHTFLSHGGTSTEI